MQRNHRILYGLLLLTTKTLLWTTYMLWVFEDLEAIVLNFSNINRAAFGWGRLELAALAFCSHGPLPCLEFHVDEWLVKTPNILVLRKSPWKFVSKESGRLQQFLLGGMWVVWDGVLVLRPVCRLECGLPVVTSTPRFRKKRTHLRLRTRGWKRPQSDLKCCLGFGVGYLPTRGMWMNS